MVELSELAAITFIETATGKTRTDILECRAEMPGFFLDNFTCRALRTIAGDGRTPP